MSNTAACEISGKTNPALKSVFVAKTEPNRRQTIHVAVKNVCMLHSWDKPFVVVNMLVGRNVFEV